MSKKRKKYCAEFKLLAVQEYLAGKGSLRKICREYGIPDHKMLRQWISCYNGHKDFKERSGAKGEIYMTKGRKTTQEEASLLVWALPVSLAATQEIEFSFSSSAYLDVSVQRVPFIK